MLEEALSYAKIGWAIFPCNQHKEPIGELAPQGVNDATTNPKTIEYWWTKRPDANIGFCPGAAGMVVIDLDPGHDRAELERLVEGLAPTLRAKTPRGGEHLFYMLDNGEEVSPSASKIATAVDIRSKGSYVLLAPSRTKAGRANCVDGAYEWAGGTDPAFTLPARRSNKLLELCKAGKAKQEDRDEWLAEPDNPQDVADYIAWCQGKPAKGKAGAKIAVQGQGGDHVAYATAAMGKSFGLAPETTLEIMATHWNPRCVPPWSADEMEHFAAKVEHAYSYNTSTPGNMSEAFKKAKLKLLFQPIQKGDPNASAPEGLWNGPDYRERPIPLYLVDGVVQERSYSMASGRSQAGKSFCEIGLSLSIATGVEWFGRAVSRSGPVLYVAAEGQSRVWKDAEAWARVNGVNSASLRNRFFIFDRSIRLNTDGGMQTLSDVCEYIHAVTGQFPIYAVFDTLRRNMRGSVSREEDASLVLEQVANIQNLGIAVTLVAHHGRGHGETKGLTDWEDDADQVRHYEGTVKAGTTKIKFDKVKSGEDGFEVPVYFEEVGDTLVARSEPAAVTQAKADPLLKKVREKKEANVQAKGDGKAGRPMALDPWVVDTAAIECLKRNPSAHWNQSNLSKAVAKQLGAGVSESTVRRYFRETILCTGAFGLYKCFEPVSGRFEPPRG